MVKLCQKIPNSKYELIGSWSVHIGDLDQYVHLWKHRGGYAAIDKTNNILQNNQVRYLYIYYRFLCFMRITILFRNISSYEINVASFYVQGIYNICWLSAFGLLLN